MLAIIGGTGFYQMEGCELLEELHIKTPFGLHSSPLFLMKYQNQEFIFLSRHGKNHQFLPHEVNYKANIWALKSRGVTQIIGISAVGSLHSEIKPGDLVLPDQYIDWVRGPREKSFFQEGLAAHVSTAKPVCAELSSHIKAAAKQLKLPLRKGSTYIGVDGPRLGTAAESHLYRKLGAHIIGMTNVPEVFLAREAQICYSSICISTDYDAWQEDESLHVSAEQAMSTYKANIEKIHNLLAHLLSTPLPKPDETYRRSLEFAVISNVEKLSDDKKALLKLLSQ